MSKTGVRLYNYGARFYDPQIGRFTTQDAYTEKYFPLTPYQYAANNPIKFIDVNGDRTTNTIKYIMWNYNGGKQWDYFLYFLSHYLSRFAKK